MAPLDLPSAAACSALVAALFAAPIGTMLLVTTFGLDRRRRRLDLLLSRAASLAVSCGRGRRGRRRHPPAAGTEGVDAADACRKRKKPKPAPETIELYDYEGCPFCRTVRFAVSDLGLDVTIKPCPRPTFGADAADAVAKGHSRFRPDVVRLGGRLLVPFLVDRNVGVRMYESGDIVQHLLQHYGDGGSGDDGSGGALSIVASFVASGLRSAPRMGLLRAAAGRKPTQLPPKLLELRSDENDPSCRLVREALCVLEVPYVLRSAPLEGAAGGEGDDHDADTADTGTPLPFLCDPNTGFRSAGDAPGAVDYLCATYLPPGTEEGSATFSASWVWRQRFQALGRGLLGVRGNGPKSE